MVGGTVIGLSRKDGRTHVHVAHCPHYPKHGRGDECPRPDTCCVYTEEVRTDTGERVEIGLGDSFWWQGGQCYWTPAAVAGTPLCDHEHHYTCAPRGTYDIPLPKIGYSH